MTAWLLLVSCFPELPACPDCPNNVDDDGDGFTINQGDCDDTSRDVRPGARETCNAIDDDCDGEIDEDALDARDLWVDADGDGYGSGNPEERCPNDNLAERGGDCDDAAGDVNPAAQEVCNDGRDNDCDGSFASCERKGTFLLGQADAFVGTAASGASLGASLAVGDDGILVGAPAFGLANAGAVFRFAPRAQWTDTTVEDGAIATLRPALLDAERDVGGGLARHDTHWVVPTDLGGRGLVYLVEGGVVGDPALADAATVTLRGALNEGIGARVAAGSDGVLISSGAAGVAAWWVEDPLDGVVAVRDVAASGVRIDGPAVDTLAVGDLDGDDDDDLVLGRGLADGEGRLTSGAVYVFFGPVAEPTALTEADVVLEGPQARVQAGSGLAVLPDLDGDGVRELAVAGPDGEGADVWIVRGPPTSGPLDATAWAVLTGSSGVELGRAIVGLDIDNDGFNDVAIAAPAEGTGTVYVAHGPFGPQRDLDDVELVLLGEGVGHEAGRALATGDVDLDGVDDLVLGEPGGPTQSPGSGGLHVWLGRGR